ncbi:MAG: hypothetical protein PHQ86_05780 [Dehalococcoidales bacterium]|nr:hypothetical protein [Dehalococcoidales bacterium]
MDKEIQQYNLTLTGNAAAIEFLKKAIADGKHWYIALLETIGLWKTAEETYNGRTYHYLIAGEAFDWLLLAERLCEEIGGLLPKEERITLLFHCKPPYDLTAKEFKELIGGSKYHQYLNYFYGITIEEALIQAVKYDVRKERQTLGHNTEQEIINEVYRRLYGSTKGILLKQFRRERSYPQLKSISLTELKEFTYWLFKYRLNHFDKAKIASDTNKALSILKDNNLPLRSLIG